MNRKKDIIALREFHPDWTGTQIGASLGITRSRVHQVLRQQGLPTRGWKALFRVWCFECGKDRLITQKAADYRRRVGYKHFFCSRKCLGKRRSKVCASRPQDAQGSGVGA